MSEKTEPSDEAGEICMPQGSLSVMLSIDASDNSEAAFDWYAERIHRDGNEVIVFNAAEPPNMTHTMGFGASYAFPEEEWRRITEEHVAKLKELQHRYELKLRGHKMHGKVVVYRVDAPGPAICKYAKENNIGLIVVGSRGLGAVRRTLLGSISDYVLHHAHTPILVVPPEASHTQLHK